MVLIAFNKQVRACDAKKKQSNNSNTFVYITINRSKLNPIKTSRVPITDIVNKFRSHKIV